MPTGSPSWARWSARPRFSPTANSPSIPARCRAPAGLATKDPAFGLDAVWIDKSRRDQAQAQGYTVVDASSVIATHLSHLLQSHAQELLGHEEVQQFLNRLGKTAPKLIEDLVPKLLPMSVVVKVLQHLLLERVPIRNLRTVCETLSELAPKTQDQAALSPPCESPSAAASCRPSAAAPGAAGHHPRSLARAGPAGFHVERRRRSGFEPGLADKIQQSLADRTRRQEAAGEPAVLLVAPKIRPWVARLMRHSSRRCRCSPITRFPRAAESAWLRPWDADVIRDEEVTMKIKRYTAAEHARRARSGAREQGPDAVILSSRRTERESRSSPRSITTRR